MDGQVLPEKQSYFFTLSILTLLFRKFRAGYITEFRHLGNESVVLSVVILAQLRTTRPSSSVMKSVYTVHL